MTTAGVRARISSHLRAPLTRSGYALLLSSVITSVLGLGYWVIAARIYDEDELGRGAALVSGMVLVTSLATAGLKRGLIRFVPAAGVGARSLVRRVYGTGLAASLLLGVIVLAGFEGFSDRLTVLHGSWYAPLVFLVGVLAWGLFVLQDAVLIGARRASLVPTTNAVFSVLKIALLVVLAVVASREWGVFLSWAVPAIVVAVGVNVWLFRRGLDLRGDAPAGEPPTLGHVVRFTGAEYVAALLWMTALYFTPLMILARAGAEANAHYYLASQIAYSLYLVSSNVTDALVAEGSVAQRDLAAKVRRNGAQVALLVIPGVAVTVLAAPQIMAVFGGGYGGEAVTTLRLLALSAVPNAVTTMVLAVAHVRRRMWLVVLLQSLVACLTLGMSWVLLDSHGVTGVAAGWLVAQLATAIVAVAVTIRVEPGLWRGVRAGLVSRAAALRKGLARRRARRLLPTSLADVPRAAIPNSPLALLGYQHDVLVVAGGTSALPLIVRVAVGRNGRRGIAAHRLQLRSVHADPELSAIAPLVPEVVLEDGANWLVETARPGRPGSSLDGYEDRTRAMVAGLGTLADLHGSTARQLVVDAELVDRWVHEPVALVAGVLRSEQAAAGLAALHRRLTGELLGRPVTVARLHGDPSFDNLLFSDGGRRVTGMVDWESSARGLPEIDVIAFVLSRRAVESDGEMGDDVADLLANGWTAEERELLGPSWSVNAHVRPTTLVLLAWLGHVAANLAKAERYRANRWWLRHNVVAVLEKIARDELGAHAVGPDPLAPDVAYAPAVERAAPAPAPRPRPRDRLRPARLRLVVAAVAVASWLAHALSAPVIARSALVVAAVLVVPAVALGRRLGAPGARGRMVVGAAGAVALDVATAEALLYTHQWSPGRFLVGVTVVAFLLCIDVPRGALPRHQPAADTTREREPVPSAVRR
ncbi:MAG: hypothetical protein JWM47_987 [Acidimicrobiales bacterium]|nr:hypothetical protein [Acidimicrobiales bacterium]